MGGKRLYEEKIALLSSFKSVSSPDYIYTLLSVNLQEFECTLTIRPGSYGKCTVRGCT